jgi:hypothetical protein
VPRRAPAPLRRPAIRRRAALIVLLPGLVALGGLAPPQAQATRADPGAPTPVRRRGADREAVLKLLGASERTPNEKELRGLGGDVDVVLVDLARDGKLEPRLRARAVSALAFAPTRASRVHLVKLVSSGGAAKDATDVLLVRRAAVALGWQGGPTATPLLGALLEHADPEVRLDAALGLGLTRQASAVQVLRARLEAESDTRVRAHVSRQLSVIESALGMAPAAP